MPLAIMDMGKKKENLQRKLHIYIIRKSLVDVIFRKSLLTISSWSSSIHLDFEIESVISRFDYWRAQNYVVNMISKINILPMDS